jgi:uncharacterized protein
LCEGYKDFFHHVDRPMRLMAGLLSEGHAPSEVMQLYLSEDAHRPRNSLCPCGSGRKWKHCHATRWGQPARVPLGAAEHA